MVCLWGESLTLGGDYAFLSKTWKLLPLASDVTGVCLRICVYTVHVCLYMTSLSALC